VTADVSFISLEKVLPAARRVAPCASMVVLIKPQFEAGRDQVGKGGVVRSPEVHEAVVEKIRRFAVESLGMDWAGVLESPLRGPAGNKEFLAFLRPLQVF
ncbi:MAG: TlyA family RNA methyltransferase, partial [Verrucomicrobiae bacterium]|nr:TlyA family RNA methyltransferase [Verrucomicrobiae bacterium]